MAEAKPPSTADLLLLITGLYTLKAPPAGAPSGEAYWLNETRTALRESVFNTLWLASPKNAWNKVKYRDWLTATLLEEIAGHKQEFISLSEPLLASIDVLGKEFTRDMKGVTDPIRELLLSDSQKERSLFTTLSVAVSKRRQNGKDVFFLGAGMRRRASLWVTESEALQADVEFFVPFYVFPNGESTTQPEYSICAGIALTRSNGGAIMEQYPDIIAVRFNLRLPFKTEQRQRVKSDEFELHTIFGDAEIEFEKRFRETTDSRASTWRKFDGWKDFVDDFCESTGGAELLSGPIGPLLLETVSDNSGIKDIVLKQSKRDEIKTDLKDVKKELDETLDLLKNIWEYEPPEKETTGPHSSQRKLGSLLWSLGLLDSKFKFKPEAGLTVSDVVNRILSELDGYPLYIKGAKPKTDKESRIAISLASQEVETDKTKEFFGLAGLAYNIALKTVSKEESDKKEDDPDETTIVISDDNFTDDESILIEDEDEETSEQEDKDAKPEKKKSTVEVYLHLGKWLSGESLDDNWRRRLLPAGDTPQKRRVPLPGIRILPFKRLEKAPPFGSKEAVFSWTFRADLLSLGIDVKGTTKDGLTFLEGMLGHFGLGAVEVRLAISISAEDLNTEKNFLERVTIGVAVKLKDLRLSFAPKEEEEKKKDSDEIIAGLQDLLADDWAVVPAPPKPKENKPRTRLSAKKKDKFSISVGYLTPLTPGSHGTLDIQLYDEKGNRGKMAWIPIDRQTPFMYLRQIGIGLKGVENIELSKGLPDGAQLTVAITGGIKLPVFELGFIGAKLIFQLNKASAFQFGLEGLDVSLKIGSVVISGSFFKSGIEFAGSLTLDFAKASFSAMGFYGSVRLFNMSLDGEIVTQLYNGRIHDKLSKKLKENNIVPAESRPIKAGHSAGQWELRAKDDTRYTITDDDGKLNILRPDKTFFVYAMLNAATGCGPALGPIQFTGIALGYGFNRRMIIPKIEEVAEFPLVQMVMGEGGYQPESKSLDPREQMGKALADPVSMLEKMKDHVVAELGQQFACGGVRFTISGVIDCFALVVVQWGNELEISLLGLARFRHTRDLTAAPICYVELQILMSLKPSEGTFKLQALLTSNSWIINTDCKLTGGFALFIWFDGPHKGDLVLTLGGYHPRFRRPAHYPEVPRLGLNWAVNQNLTIKGGVYLAITPSCGMLGAKLEATFHSGRISAWFTVYLDVIVNWSPLYFEAELGISLRVEASFFLTSIKVTIAASIMMWGPPVGGIAHIDLTVISFDIDFGSPRQKQPELIKSWQQFCHDFLSVSGEDTRPTNTGVKAFVITQPNLASGRNNIANLPRDRRARQQQQDDTVWKVRGDELELSGSSVVPVATLNAGKVKNGEKAIQDRKLSGQSLMVTTAVELDSAGFTPKKSASPLGVQPMGKKLDSVLNVTVVRDEGAVTEPVNLSGWTIEEETGALPAALWDAAKPALKSSEPSARLITGCIVGIKQFKPPPGKLGPSASVGNAGWQPLEVRVVKKEKGSQEFPATTHSRNVQSKMISGQTQQKKIVEALSTLGFSLQWQPATRFRDLQADPLAGAVASI